MKTIMVSTVLGPAAGFAYATNDDFHDSVDALGNKAAAVVKGVWDAYNSLPWWAQAGIDLGLALLEPGAFGEAAFGAKWGARLGWSLFRREIGREAIGMTGKALGREALAGLRIFGREAGEEVATHAGNFKNVVNGVARSFGAEDVINLDGTISRMVGRSGWGKNEIPRAFNRIGVTPIIPDHAKQRAVEWGITNTKEEAEKWIMETFSTGHVYWDRVYKNWTISPPGKRNNIAIAYDDFEEVVKTSVGNFNLKAHEGGRPRYIPWSI